MSFSFGMPFGPTNGIEGGLSPYVGRRGGSRKSRITAIGCDAPSSPLVEGIEVVMRGGGGDSFERAGAVVVIGGGGGFGVVVVV